MISDQIWFLAGCIVWGAALVVWFLMRREHHRMMEWAREWDRQSEDAHQRHMAEMALAMRRPRPPFERCVRCYLTRTAT